MAHERIKPEFLFDEEKIKQLKQIAPECFEDGKLNFETLRQNLGDWKQDEEDGELEHFGLFWPGKKDARRLATIRPEGTLEPIYGEGLKSDGTPDDDGVNDSKNIFIEGENLEVLKILQKSYANKIKMIYIDPPYNTGNDFVYDDDFTEPLQEYLRRTGQIDDEGKPLTTNKKSDGRFHSKWLSMMYPRLRLARNLLKDDGLIFISINDNEIVNLRLLMNEIFGEENYQQQISWKNKYGPGAQTKGFGNLHEYVLCYSKTPVDEISAHLDDSSIKKYNQKDEKVDLRGGFITQPLATKSKDDRPNLVYPLVHNGIEIWPDKQWIWSKERLQKAYDNGEVVVKENNGKYSVRFKQYLKDENGVMRMGKPLSMMIGPYNQDGSKEINRLFGKAVFDFPKPVELIKYFFSMVVNGNDQKDEYFLDFFAGSGSSAQALYELNESDQGKRKMISVQLPVKIDKSKLAYKEGYKRITEITKNRLKLVQKECRLPSGFCVFKLTYSNYKKWNDVEGTSVSQLENSLDLFNNSPLREDWNKNKLITELMLLEGFPLDATQTKSQIGSNEIVTVQSEMVPNTLLICIDDEIEESLIEKLELDVASTFICLDSAISNQNKLRLSDKGLIKTI